MNVKIEFEDLDLASANRQIIELNNTLLRNDPTVKTEILSRSGHMDAGSILSITLSAPAVLLIIKGITNYLKRRNNVKLSIKKDDESIIATGIDSQTAIELVSLFKKELNEDS